MSVGRWGARGRRMVMAAGVLVFAGSCVAPADSISHGSTTPEPSSLSSEPPEPSPEEVAVSPNPVMATPCESGIPRYREGQQTGDHCPNHEATESWTVVNLSDRWAPSVFPEVGGEDQGPSFHPYYVALANERLEMPRGFRVNAEKYMELYGIFPSLSVVERRGQRGDACPSIEDLQALPPLQGTYGRAQLMRATRGGSLRQLRHWERQLERARVREGLATLDALQEEPRHAALYSRWKERDDLRRWVANIQATLSCEGLLGRYSPGRFTGATFRALRDWQRKNMIIARGELDPWTQHLVSLGPAERAFRSGLRVLRERVVAATGLIEDGSASDAAGTVLGRQLDPPEIRTGASRVALENGAPDLISSFTEAAAQSLGWTDPASFMRFLAERSPENRIDWRVALPLPDLPAYYGGHMALRAEIDRGDVRRSRAREGDRRPTMTLFVEHEGETTALIRWNTTIGGWQRELTSDGRVIRRYKESPVGPRVWRDVLASPVWFPPPSTPDGELIWGSGPRASIKWSLMGPGPRSAYGLLMVMHHELAGTMPDGTPRVRDEGIRVHGSVSYRSILTGNSHGCHRLYNHLALRLGAFLVAHRNHENLGMQTADYRRTVTMPPVEEPTGEESVVEVEGEQRTIRLHHRGHLYRLDPPVPVEVLEGTVHRWGRRSSTSR